MVGLLFFIVIVLIENILFESLFSFLICLNLCIKYCINGFFFFEKFDMRSFEIGPWFEIKRFIVFGIDNVGT